MLGTKNLILKYLAALNTRGELPNLSLFSSFWKQNGSDFKIKNLPMVLGEFMPKLVKMAPSGERPKD